MISSTNELISNEFWKGNDEEQLYFDYGSGKTNGYLLNPEGSRLIFFEECKNPKILISKFIHIISIQIT